MNPRPQAMSPADFVETPPVELMDGEDLAFEETLRALEDLRRANRRLFGYLPVVRELGARRAPGDRLLDLGTGSGDVGQTLMRAGRRRGREARIFGVDFKLRHLVVGRQWYPDQLRVVASAQALPFADGCFEDSFSTLFFHHFGSQANGEILAEMRRVSRHRAIVVDLRRSLVLRLLIRPLLRLLGTGSVATNDGYISARNAWSLRQVRALLEGMPYRLRRRFPFRFVLVLPGCQPD